MKVVKKDKRDVSEKTRQVNTLEQNREILDKVANDVVDKHTKLFIPVKAPDCPMSVSEPSAPASGDTETRAELDGRVAQALVDLTARGDQAIRQLNTCIDQYNQVRSMK